MMRSNPKLSHNFVTPFGHFSVLCSLRCFANGSKRAARVRSTSGGDGGLHQKRWKPLSSCNDGNCNDRNVNDIDGRDAATTGKSLVARPQMVVFMTPLEMSTTACLATALQLRHEHDSHVEVEQVAGV